MQERLRELREVEGLTQADLAARWNISANYYSRIERGSVEPGPKLRRAIESFLSGKEPTPTGAGSSSDSLDQIREVLQWAARDEDEIAVLEMFRNSPEFRAMALAAKKVLKGG